MAGCGTKRMNMGGMTKGMHKMPDGTVMKDSAHKMTMGAGRGYKAGGKIDGCAKRGRTNCKMR
jgi:hypothetical protein